MGSILAKVAVCLAAPALLPPIFGADDCAPQAPCYTAAGIVNSASGEIDSLAPYTFVTIYGTNLSYNTRERGIAGAIPKLGGVGVTIYNAPALVTYVSPTQVNALIPYSLKANRDSWLQLSRDGVLGPRIPIRLREFAPAFFQDGPENAVAQHEDWTYIKPDSPGLPGGYAILYLTGLGPTLTVMQDWEPPSRAVAIQARLDLQVLLDGQPVEDSRIEYAGLVPSIPGLYQINLKLPETTGPNPEIRISIRGEFSRPGLYLPLAGTQ